MNRVFIQIIHDLLLASSPGGSALTWALSQQFPHPDASGSASALCTPCQDLRGGGPRDRPGPNELSFISWKLLQSPVPVNSQTTTRAPATAQRGGGAAASKACLLLELLKVSDDTPMITRVAPNSQ